MEWTSGNRPLQTPADHDGGVLGANQGVDTIRAPAGVAQARPKLKTLMKSVASGNATQQELRDFKRCVDEIQAQPRTAKANQLIRTDYRTEAVTDTTISSSLKPTKTALVIVDMQSYFGHMMDAPLPYIKKLHAFFRSHSWPIVFTQHGHEPSELIPPIRNQLIRKVGPDNALMVGTPGWELMPEIWKLAGDAPVVAKNTYDAFERTTLHALLHREGVGRIVVCGVMTEVCCETTVRSAFVKDYEAWLVSDACGTVDPAGHERAVESARRLLDNVMSTQEAIERLTAESSPGSLL